MQDIYIAGTGIWYPEDIITNDEIVSSFNSYVDKYNDKNQEMINDGTLAPLAHSSTEFIEKASGIKTRHVIDCLLYTSPSPRDQRGSRMPSSA